MIIIGNLIQQEILQKNIINTIFLFVCATYISFRFLTLYFFFFNILFSHDREGLRNKYIK